MAKFRVSLTHTITQWEVYEIEAESEEEARELLEWGPENGEDAVDVNIRDHWDVDSVEEISEEPEETVQDPQE